MIQYSVIYDINSMNKVWTVLGTRFKFLISYTASNHEQSGVEFNCTKSVRYAHICLLIILKIGTHMVEIQIPSQALQGIMFQFVTP